MMKTKNITRGVAWARIEVFPNYEDWQGGPEVKKHRTYPHYGFKFYIIFWPFVYFSF